MDAFYTNLPSFFSFSDFSKKELYQALPADWWVVVSDIKGSTQAIQDGKYKDVNALGVASIVAVLNSLEGQEVPYVFGGDGATLCIPDACCKTVSGALRAAQEMAHTAFQLELRIGMVPVSHLLQKNKPVFVAKYQSNPNFQQAMFLGDGLQLAESLIKAPNSQYLVDSDILAEGHFTGFECRWNEIPSRREETISLLVQVLDNNDFTLYEKISERIFDIYGDVVEHHPLSESVLTLASKSSVLQTEAKLQASSVSKARCFLGLCKLKVLTALGKWLMNKKHQTSSMNWGNYKQTLIANSDYRKFDEILRMVLAGNKEHRILLMQYLKNLQEQSKIVFGLHISDHALMTCIVSDYNKNHVHFLDGSNGGYAMAAKQMKEQISTSNS